MVYDKMNAWHQMVKAVLVFMSVCKKAFYFAENSKPKTPHNHEEEGSFFTNLKVIAWRLREESMSQAPTTVEGY
jgi:hypothetical protein